jgi:molecular chaperone DnaK
MTRIIRATERAKCQLSTLPYTQILEEFLSTKLDNPLHMKREISRLEFESIIEGLIRKTLEIIDSSMRDSGLHATDLSQILLVGGSTRIPFIQEKVGNFLNKMPILSNEPELCVAKGAAIQGGIIAGEAIDSILVDITPFSLGIEVVDFKHGALMPGCFDRIISRNTVIPNRMSKVYSTLFDNQEAIEVKIYQGENEVAAMNTFLGSFLLDKIPPMKAGMAKIVVDFKYNINGILEVNATEKSEKKSGRLKIELNNIGSKIDAPGKEDRNKKLKFKEEKGDSYDKKILAILVKRSAEIVERLEPAKKAEMREILEKISKFIDKGQSFESMEKSIEILEDFVYDYEFKKVDQE